MAKKKTETTSPTTTPTTPPKAGKGKKFCPHCESLIPAASTICPECKEVIPSTSKKKKTSKPADAIKQAIQTIKAMGGLDAVKGQIDATDKALEAFKALGGLEQAREAVKVVEELRSL